MKVADVTRFLESLAPRAYQESYDNSGLLTGSPNQEVTGILVTLDCIEAVVDEAIQRQCNMIVAHHPIIFKGLKKITGSNYVERTVLKAIKNDIAIYAIHTNLDNVHTGVNKKIAERLGLQKVKVLSPKSQTLTKLVTFAPTAHANAVLDALYEAGAGQIGNYKNCSFQVNGTGTFMPNDQATPHIGQANTQESVSELRVEVILPTHVEARIISALKKAHPYEEVAYYLTSLVNENQEVGSGMIGELETEMLPEAFLSHVKACMNTPVIRHTVPPERPIRSVALCGGSGSFLLPEAIRQGAQAFISADFKYHEFFDADNQIIIADIGHYESEAFTKDLLTDILKEKFPTFAVNFSGTSTNPVRYLID
ncbi:MAG: Nif3-like dinuclear metal center hexameric protein [Cyclobacteriaceae bacterium]|nr:Nif3-like dinuclear metal center hexameric protein [Cyclobacteriaceae bacterium]